MTQQVKVAKEVVDGIINAASVQFQKFDNAPVYQARMITDFGFCLKSFGEAAVADPSSFDPEFAGKLARGRLMDSAHPEVWAHEGWKLMQCMNAAGDHVLPQLQAHINSLTSCFGRRLHNLPQIFWAMIGQQVSHHDLRHIPDFEDLADPEAIPVSTAHLVTIVLHAVSAHIEFFEDKYEGIADYWRHMLYAPCASDWDPMYEIMIMSQPLLVSQIVDVAHVRIQERMQEQALTRDWHVARSLVFNILVELASYKFDQAKLMPQNNIHSALRFGDIRNVAPYDEQLNASLAAYGRDKEMERYLVLDNSAHHDALCASAYNVVVDSVAEACTSIFSNVADDDEAEPRIWSWARDMRKL